MRPSHVPSPQPSSLVHALRQAGEICRAVQGGHLAARAKSDRSPVTVADFASQAVVFHALDRAGHAPPYVGEEDAGLLRADPELADAVLTAAHPALPGLDRSGLLDLLDRGGSPGGRARAFWTLDPLDGTKGFLRGGQYAIALARVEVGKVVESYLACPALPFPAWGAPGSPGCLFQARAGEGAWMWPWSPEIPGPPVPLRVAPPCPTSDLRFCEPLEAAHAAHEETAQLAARLGIRADPVRMDSQAKYAAVARGDAEAYLRLARDDVYRECIWDHAAGVLLVEEAGGRVTDQTGRPLDFGEGRRLESSRGILASHGSSHPAILAGQTA